MLRSFVSRAVQSRSRARAFSVATKRKVPPQEKEEEKPRVFVVDDHNRTTCKDTLVESLTPKAIVAHLNQHVVGQDEAKKAVSIALRNRWRRTKLQNELKEEITPSNILMIGPTGSGKTEISRRLARLLEAPLVKVEATKYTEVGIVGATAEDCIKDLVDRTVEMERDLLKKKLKPEIEASVDSILLSRIPGASTKRDEFHKKLREGELENITIEFVIRKSAVPESKKRKSNFTAVAQSAKEEKKMKAPVGEARELLRQSELERHMDEFDVSKRAIHRAENSGIVIIDEIDKITGGSSGLDYRSNKGEGVQKELLSIVEGTTVQTDHGPCKTDHILFIGAGSFHLSKPSDLLPELQGRLPIRVELAKLTEEDFVKILVETKNNLLDQQIALFETEGLNVEFNEEAVSEIAKVSSELNCELENIGARRLRAVVSKVVEELSYDAPDKQGETIYIDREFVREKTKADQIVFDHSRFVL